MRASYYTREEHGKVRCALCPQHCSIDPGTSGKCGIRYNNGDFLEASGYGLLSGLALDPLEKKPLYHFYPGKKILSAGGFGCNLSCNFCQNHEISQPVGDFLHRERYSPGQLALEAGEITDNTGIAFTYNEPVISFEFVRDTSEKILAQGQFTVMVSNGFIAEEPLIDLLPFISAWNVDLKGFRNSFYVNECKGWLKPVLDSLVKIREYGSHLEITTLIIPGKNDTEKEMREMCRWIAGNLGKETVLHLSRYFPRYRSEITSTSIALLKQLYEVACQELENVYAGNITEDFGSNSKCPSCSVEYIVRNAYRVSTLPIENNHCPHCGNLLYGKF